MLLSPRRSALHLLLIGIALLVVPRVAQARLTKFVVDKARSQSPSAALSNTAPSFAFGGYSWPGVGKYEKIVGTGFGELDPTDPKNAVIVDLGLAPKNTNGNVDYRFDFYILKPVDLGSGAHKVMYEPPNRGNKTWATLGRFSGGNDPGAETNAGTLANAFFMPRGYTIVFSGWDKAAPAVDATGFPTAIVLPVAQNPDSSTITGPGYEYIVTGAGTFTLAYPAASTDKTKAMLTHRVHLNDTPTILGSSAWGYTNANGTAIKLNPSAVATGDAAACVVNGVATTCFVANDIYEFTYTAKNPTVNTVGLAAIRDFNAWLRYEVADSLGNPNPLAGDVRRIYTEVVSQPGRTLNDFTHLGFNQAENGKRVFDGMLQWIAAGDGLSMNFRWSQPGRTERNRQEHLFNEAPFPFANVMTTDPFSGVRDSRFARCEQSHTCPVAMEVYSANEYWVKAASLLHTTPDGKRDLPDSPFARDYFISSHMHGSATLGADGTTGKGNCQQMQNPLNSAPIQRALWVAMEHWVEHHEEPPRTQVPTFRDHTLVPPNQSAVGFPHIPGVRYTGLKTTRYRFNWGPGFYQSGIPSFNPPVAEAGPNSGQSVSFSPPFEDNPNLAPIYPSFVPKTDRDGNDIAGVHLADVTVPVATYTGWALRAGPQANDGCESSGQFIPFPKTEVDGKASGDPRRSVEERYQTLDHYVRRVAHALNRMVEERVLLCEEYDAELNRLTALGAIVGGLAPDPNGHGSHVPALPESCRKDYEDDD
jgi:Alpha/beta hydrolase domain